MSLGSIRATSSDQSSTDRKDKLSEKCKLSLLLTPTSELRMLQRQTKSNPGPIQEVTLVPAPTLLVNPARFRTMETLDTFKQAVFLFGDMKGSTRLGQQMSSTMFAKLLEPIFTTFQDIVIQYGEAFGIYVVKLKGDGIMIAGASHEQEKTHKQVQMMLYIGHLMAHFMSTSNQHKDDSEFKIDFRFGIHMGEATKIRTHIKQEAGIIEQIDWTGDAANKASRMESSSHPNQVQITEEIYKIAEQDFIFTTSRERAIESYGTLFTRFLMQPSPAFLDSIGHLRLERRGSDFFSTELPRKVL